VDSNEQVPEVRFNEEETYRIFPRPIAKCAVLVQIPLTNDEQEMPTFIRPSWGGVQVFYGNYYAIVENGVVVYGSAKDQWLAMHSQIKPGYWVKTAVPTAYQATATCRIVTLIPSDDGGIREASYTLEPGDWIVRQPGGEVQHIKAAVFEDIYFSREEARSLGFNLMTDTDFAIWAAAQTGRTSEA
jgi:hypothetical protein